MPVRLDHLRAAFTDVRTAIERIDQAAASERRDLTDEEQEQHAQLFARAEQLRAEIEPEAERHRSLEATAGILAALGIGQHAHATTADLARPAQPSDVDPFEYLASYCRAADPSNPNRGRDLEQHVAHYRTVATQTTADNAGILPTPIVGPLITFMDNSRYVVPTLTTMPMTGSGKQFTRPRITQHVAVAEQVAELDELTSQKMTTASSTVTKRTFGGSLQMSQQDIDWTDPSALQLVFQDFADVYTKVTDAAAASSLVAAATATVTWTGTSLGTVMTSLANAASSVYTAASAMPTDLWVDFATGLALGTMTLPNGALAFPEIGSGALVLTDPQLGIGGPLGLRLHVCPNLPANTRILGNRKYGEWYEQRNGFLQVAFPSALKIELAYYGYVAQFYTSAGFVKLV